jgi:integrase
MSIKRVGVNKWHIMAVVRVKGKSHPVTRKETFIGTKTEAECRNADIIRDVKSGGSLKYQNIRTFGEAISLYAEKLQAEGKLSPDHKRKIDRINKDLGHVRINAVAEYFDAYRKHLMHTPTASGKMRKAASINRPTEIVRAVFNYLVAVERVAINPITKIRFPRLKETPRNRHLTQEERLALINTIKQHRPHILPIITYMALVPCRVSELTTARREQYLPLDKMIFIPTSKSGVSIYKPIPPELYDYFDNIPDGSPWLFYREGAKGKYHPIALRKAWSECLRLAGITDLHIHDLRHIAATGLIDIGNPAEAVALIAGWRSTHMIRTYYNHDSRAGAQKIMLSAPEPEIAIPTAKVGI